MTKQFMDSLNLERDDDNILAVGDDTEMCSIISANRAYHKHLKKMSSAYIDDDGDDDYDE